MHRPNGQLHKTSSATVTMVEIRLMCICVISVLVLVVFASAMNMNRKVPCDPLPSTILTQILGSAFNSRYMSIDVPMDHSDGDDVEDGPGNKRKADQAPSFYVGGDFMQDINDQPAWEVDHTNMTIAEATQKIEKKKIERRSVNTARQWDCESKIKWTDLGPDYFPRFLRSVECLSKSCWFGHFTCKPRSFTIKLLRRKPDRCAPVGSKERKMGVVGIPMELRELWVWEERAVTFCCDCSAA